VVPPHRYLRSVVACCPRCVWHQPRATAKRVVKNVLSGVPKWMCYAVYALFAYAIANFALVFTTSGPQPEGDAPPSVIRGFSGHWMVFYGAAFATLLSAYLKPALLKKQKCSKGHDVSSTDVFCPKCGSEINLRGR
jgi:hypothetical protein